MAGVLFFPFNQYIQHMKLFKAFVAVSATLVTFLIVWLLLTQPFPATFVSGQCGYCPYPVNMEMKGSLKNVVITYEVTYSESEKMYSYKYHLTCKEKCIFNWEVFDKLLGEESHVYLKELDKSEFSFNFKSPHAPVMYYGKASFCTSPDKNLDNVLIPASEFLHLTSAGSFPGPLPSNLVD